MPHRPQYHETGADCQGGIANKCLKVGRDQNLLLELLEIMLQGNGNAITQTRWPGPCTVLGATSTASSKGNDN